MHYTIAFSDNENNIDNDNDNDNGRTTPESELNELSDGEYERERLENIKHRDALLSSLGLDVPKKPHHLYPQQQQQQPQMEGSAGQLAEKTRMSREDAKKRKVAKEREKELRRVEPVRKSRRVAERAGKDKDGKGTGDDDDQNPLSSSRKPSNSINRYMDPLPKATRPTLPPGPEYSSGQIENEKQPRPLKGDGGRLVFEGRWRGVFTPNVTPEEMFGGGAFGGSFFRDTYSGLLRTPLSSDAALASLPFPPPFPGSDINTIAPNLLTSRIPKPSVNRFQVLAGQSLEEWEKAGWIWPGDPRGWAEWYVRFWDGRRCEDDERQVRRWLNVAGPTGRFKRALLKKIQKAGGQVAVGDEDVGRVLRQCLWQWGYELTEREYEEAMGGP